MHASLRGTRTSHHVGLFTPCIARIRLALQNLVLDSTNVDVVIMAVLVVGKVPRNPAFRNEKTSSRTNVRFFGDRVQKNTFRGEAFSGTGVREAFID